MAAGYLLYSQKCFSLVGLVLVFETKCLNIAQADLEVVEILLSLSANRCDYSA